MNILLASANRAVTKRWETLLAANSKFTVATTTEDLKNKCLERTYDLVLLHRLLVNENYFQELRKNSPQNRFFVLSDQPSEEEGLSYLKLGIVGYGNTYISSTRLAEAIRVVSAGGVWLGQKVIQALIQESYSRIQEKQGAENTEDLLAGLTKAERKIAELVARGQSNLEIAADLNITERTVKAHLTSIYEKTKTGNRLNLALLINRL
jgi:DNA-binding NarL/FixJ family response regulator